MEDFIIRRDKDGILDLENVSKVLRNIANINNADAPELHISVSDSKLTVNGESFVYGKGAFSEMEILQILDSLKEKGAEVNPYGKNCVTFREPVLFLGEKEEKEKNITVDLESAIRAIRNLASVNNRDSKSLYIDINDNGWAVNGDGINYFYSFTEDDKSMIVSKLKELGAESSKYVKYGVNINEPAAFWNYGPAIPEEPDFSIKFLTPKEEKQRPNKK